MSFGLCCARQLAQRVVVDRLRVRADEVRHHLERLARVVERVAVSEVAAVREVEAEDRVAGRAGREVDRHVRLGAGVRLDVDVVATEELLGAGARQLLGDVHALAAAVVALAGVAFGVLVGHHRTHGREHRGGDEVLGRDQLESLVLAAALVADGGRDLGVALADRGLQEVEERAAFVLVHDVAPCPEATLRPGLVVPGRPDPGPRTRSLFRSCPRGADAGRSRTAWPGRCRASGSRRRARWCARPCR